MVGAEELCGCGYRFKFGLTRHQLVQINVRLVSHLLTLSLRLTLYKVTLVVEYLGWADLDLGCSTTLLGQ